MFSDRHLDAPLRIAGPAHPQGREDGRFASPAVNQVRASSSTHRLPGYSASKCRRPWSPAPTRWSN